MHTEILTGNQTELLPHLKNFNRKFYLVGGTAIALHIGHRRSLDFDLFCRSSFKKNYIAEKFGHIPFKKEKIFEDIDQSHFNIHQTKFTFFYFPFDIPHPNRLKNSIQLPDLITLAAMKAYALGRRAKWKDYVDLYFIIRDYFTIEQISIETQKYFEGLFSEKLFRQQLSFHKDINYSEPVEFLVPVPSEEEIKQFLIDKALDLGF